MDKRIVKTVAGRAILALLALVAFMPQAATAQFNCFPTCDIDDGRFLVIAAGDAFRTLSDPTLDLTFIVPAGTASFDIGIFDGDILDSDGLGAFHWDTGASGVFEYTVFADPDFNVSGSLAIVGPLSTTTPGLFPDNDWVDFTITTGPEAQTANGDYVYRLRIEILNPETTVALNAFKVRTTNLGVIEPIAQPFGYIANWTNADDGAIIYPAFPALLPNTYDGTFKFFIEAPGPQASFSVWDGDFDRGSWDLSFQDTDDPNTPNAPFEPVWATIDTDPEGIAVGIAGTTGDPSDDLDPDFLFPGFGLFYQRAPAIEYTLTAPDAQVFSNDNPSGNREWEEFKISTTAGDPTADLTTTTLPGGSYVLDINGVDMANLNFLLTPFRVLCADENGDSCESPGDRPLFEIGDTVFEDLDGSGLQNGSEPGIQGVIVNLLGMDGNVLDSMVTDELGNYSFAVYPGEYSVEVADENLVPPAVLGSVGDKVWLDVNGDGSEGAGEPGISNVTVHLYLDTDTDGIAEPGGDDTFLGETNTDMNGEYSFDGLPDGDYFTLVVDSSLPAGLALSGGTDPSAIVPIAGNFNGSLDFGYENGGAGATALVGDFVWSDANGDGIQDPGEAGIGNVTVELLLDLGGAPCPVGETCRMISGVLYQVVSLASTGGDGSYLFAGVAPGDYRVEVIDTAGILAGYTLTAGPQSSSNPTAEFTVSTTPPDDVILVKDFGYQNAALFDISDSVWFDANRDGIRDEIGTGIVGVTVNLLDVMGQVVATTTTDSGGDFTFPDLPDGDYTLEITDHSLELAGLLATTTASARRAQAVTLAGADVTGINFGWVDSGALEGYAGTTDDGDGDVDRHTDTVVDADIPDYDFGYRGTGSIGDRVWEDADGNTSQAGEDGINGVTVELLRDSIVIDTQITIVDGNYLFENLPPGDYTVRVTPPAGFIQTFDIEGPLDHEASLTLLPNEMRDDVDFGYQKEPEVNGSIGDRVWNDVNGDGVQDGGEAGINDVTVRLFNAGGGLEAIDMTAGNGEYLFEDLTPGTYTVVVDSSTLPAGFVQTFDIEGPLDHEAEVILGSGENPRNVDFGYADECLPEFDFETDGASVALIKGQRIDDEWAAFGVTVSTGDSAHPAMIFDSSMPSGGDWDLGTPNETFNGPGIGSGGEDGQPGENAVPLGKVLIISEDDDSDDPDDDASGGTITFDFAYPVRVDEVGILDIDEGLAGTVTARDDGGSVIGTVGMANILGNNSVQTVAVGVSGVRSLEISFPGSGAVSGIVFCADDCAPVRVRDDFEVSSFGNNDGPDAWSGDWIENDPEPGGAGPLAGQVQVHDGYLTLDDYPNTGGEPSAAREVDLSGAASATVSFTFLTSSGVDSDDAVTVEVSNDGGATWSTLEVFTGIHGAIEDDRSYDISAFISSETQVRFRVSNKYGGSGELFCVSYLQIETDCGDCQSVTVRDNFDVSSFGNNDGSDDWSGDWIENDPQPGGAGPLSGQVKIKNGFLRLDDAPDTGGHPSLAREVDLSGAGSATLNFDFDTSSGVDKSDAVTVEISADGGASWTTLEVITDIYGSTWQERSFDITPFISAQTQVRFRVSSYYSGDNEYFYVNYVEITSSCDGGGGSGSCGDAGSVSGLSGSKGTALRYTFDVDSCAQTANFQISGGSGDADLYVLFGSEPTTRKWDCRPYLDDNNEVCTIQNPSAGTWHIMVRGYQSFSGVLLEASYE